MSDSSIPTILSFPKSMFQRQFFLDQQQSNKGDSKVTSEISIYNENQNLQTPSRSNKYGENLMIYNVNSNLSSNNNSEIISQNGMRQLRPKCRSPSPNEIQVNENTNSQKNSNYSRQNKNQNEEPKEEKQEINEENNQNNKLYSKVIEFDQSKIQKLKKIMNQLYDKHTNVNNHVAAFCQLLLSQNLSRKTNVLSEQDICLINDQSYHFKKKKSEGQNHIMKLIYKTQVILNNLLSQLKIFKPTDFIVITWNIIYLFFTSIFLYFFSILIFFAQDQDNPLLVKSIFQIISLLFVIDMFFSFNTAYFDKDFIIKKRKLIAKKYLKSYFFFDSISFSYIIYHLYFYQNSPSYNPENSIFLYVKNMIIFTRIFGLFSKVQSLQQLITLNNNQKHLLKLFNLVTSVVFVAHIVCILWHSLAVYEQSNDVQMTWIIKANLQLQPWIQRYIYSLYWSVTTMTTVGYGDITPTNIYEALFATINMILISCVFAYSINNIGMILQEIERNSKELIDDISITQRYLDRKHVNVELKTRITYYLSFLSSELNDRNKAEEEKVISKLSNKLREELTFEINTKVLKKHSIFRNNFSEKTLQKLVFVMQEVLVSPNEIIFEEDDVDDQSIYFIEGGIIEIFYSSNKNRNRQSMCINKLKQDQLFGEISFFTGLPRKASARSVNLSTLYKVQRSQFIEIVKKNREDFERFKMIEEQVKIYKDFKALSTQCFQCNSKKHLFAYCPKIHQNFDKQKIILQYNFSIFQERKENFNRKQVKICYEKTFFLIKQNQVYSKILQNKQNQFDSKTRLLFTQNNEFESEEEEEEKSQKRKMKSFQSNSFETSSSSSPSQGSEGSKKSLQKSQSNNSQETQKEPETENKKDQESSEKSIETEKKNEVNVYKKSQSIFIRQNQPQYDQILQFLKQQLQYQKEVSQNKIDVTINIMEQFEQVMNFNWFFPYNNINKIIEKFKKSNLSKKTLVRKQRTNQNASQQRSRRKRQKSVQLSMSEVSHLININKQNQIQKVLPTSISYGVGINENRPLPKMYV